MRLSVPLGLLGLMKRSDTLVDADGRFTRVSEADLIFREVESLSVSRERLNLKADTLHLDSHHLKFAHSHHPTATHPTATIQLLEPRVHPDRISPLPPLPHSRPRPTLEKRGILQASIASSLQLTARLKPSTHQPHRRPTGRPDPADTESRTWDGAAQSSPLTGSGRDCRGHDGSGRRLGRQWEGGGKVQVQRGGGYGMRLYISGGGRGRGWSWRGILS